MVALWVWSALTPHLPRGYGPRNAGTRRRARLQHEYLVPVGGQRLVLGVRLQPVVDQLEHAERVGLAAQVGRRQPLGPVHADRQRAHVAHVPERPGDRVLSPHVFGDLHAVVGRRVRDHRVRRRAADGQQQVQHAGRRQRRSGVTIGPPAAAAVIASTAAAAGTGHLLFDFVRLFPFQLVQIDDGAGETV